MKCGRNLGKLLSSLHEYDTDNFPSSRWKKSYAPIYTLMRTPRVQHWTAVHRFHLQADGGSCPPLSLPFWLRSTISPWTSTLIRPNLKPSTNVMMTTKNSSTMAISTFATMLPLKSENVLSCTKMQRAAYSKRMAMASKAMGMWILSGRSEWGNAEPWGSDRMNMMVMAI